MRERPGSGRARPSDHSTTQSAQDVSRAVDRAVAWDWPVLADLCAREAERLLGRGADAQDAAQEALARAWRRRHTCADPGRPGPWVRAIAGREALRIAARRREEPLDAAPEPAVPGPEEAALERMAVRRLVARLPRPERELLFATYWEDLAGTETARRACQPDVTLRVRLHRARRALERPLGRALGRLA